MELSFFTFCMGRRLRWLWAFALLLVGGTSAAGQPPMSFDLLSIDMVRQPWTSAGPRGGVAPSGVLLLGSGHYSRPDRQRVDAAVLRDDGGEAYRVEGSTLVWMPQGVGGPSQEIDDRREPPALASVSGAAWDSTHGVLGIVSSAVDGYFYRYDTRNHRWLDAHATKYSGVKGLAYNAGTGGYAAVTDNAELLIFNGQGEIEDVRPLAHVLPQLDSAREPFGIGLEGLGVVAQGDRIALINVRAGIVTHIWTYETGSRAAQLSYRLTGASDATAGKPESVAAAPDAIVPQRSSEGGPERLDATSHGPAHGFMARAIASESGMALAALVSMAGLLALLAWSLARPTAWRGRGLRLLAALVLTVVPLLMLYGSGTSEANLLLGPRQLWIALNLLIAAWRLHVPLAHVLSAQVQVSLVATGICAMAVLTCGLLLAAPRRRSMRWLAFGVMVLLAVLPARYFAIRYQDGSQYERELRAGEAVFDSLCKSAGVKRLYAVGNVEGVRLTALRNEAATDARKDRDWPDAGIPGDRVGMAYVRSFLDFEYQDRGNPAWSVPGLPGAVTLRGYRFVDVLQPDGSYLRYRLATGGSKGELDVEQIAPEQAARYAVAYARNDTPQDRVHWVAGATVGITDTQTGAQLAALKVFAHVPPRRNGDFEHRDWQEARICPAYDDVPGAMARMFVESTLQQAPR